MEESLLGKKNNQITGNIGLFYCCYQLSKMGWNVLPTSRNARGIDIIAYEDKTQDHFVSIQVKTLSKKNPVPIGNSKNKIMGNFWIIVIVNNIEKNFPKSYILTQKEVKKFTEEKRNDEGKLSYWLQPKHYCIEKFLEQWGKIRV